MAMHCDEARSIALRAAVIMPASGAGARLGRKKNRQIALNRRTVGAIRAMNHRTRHRSFKRLLADTVHARPSLHAALGDEHFHKHRSMNLTFSLKRAQQSRLLA
jgi:hypothetical protein